MRKNDKLDGITSGELAAELAVIKDSALEKKKDRKRKRKDFDDDVEGRYMRQLVLEEIRDEEKLAPTNEASKSAQGMSAKPAHSRHTAISADPTYSDLDAEEGENVESAGEEPPQHETVAPNKKDSEFEKSARTVFLANVCTSTIKSKIAKKTLMDHLASFIHLLPKSSMPHAVESLRFRSTAFADSGIPRKAALIKKELMETTTKSTNAYAVYTTQVAAREALKRLNGTMVLDRHLRGDSVAHPAKQDHRRCVFVGNLGFVDDTTAVDEAKNEGSQSKPRRGKEPADIEEGLWRQFGKAGTVESVRVVRDKTTRVGKGFAYVQFWDANAVEKALLLNEKKFPPMLPRILRVTRAKNVTKTEYTRDDRGKWSVKKPAARKRPKSGTGKPSKELNSLLGRANKLLGRAGGAQVNGRRSKPEWEKIPTRSSNKRAESFKNKMKQRQQQS